MSQNTRSTQNASPTRSNSRGLAGVLAALAGGPGVWRQRRRGSFLILVVGTLALLAVFSIVYVTIGNQDTRARAAINTRENLDEVPRQFADYVANQVIGPDALATWFDDKSNTGSNGQIKLRRKASDYPSINWFATSTGGRDDEDAFFPLGSVTPGALASKDQFLPTTPWLSSTEPTFLDFGRSGPIDPNRPYLDDVDWAQISNFAPDGRFVNLFNLRKDFEATHDEMAADLSLFGPDGRAVQTTDFGVAIDPDRPAFFTARQRGAFAPIGFNPGGYGFGDKEYPLYQWADVDGDGIRDARFFEMVDGRDAGASVASLLGANPGKYRFFFAARAIDLSALVNVNTAGDSVSAPTGTAPWGVSPADVDLRRLLTMIDVYDNLGAGYDAILNKNGIAETDYSNSSGEVPYNEENAFFAGSGGYTALRLAIASGTTVPKIGTLGGPAFTLADAIGTPSSTLGTGLYATLVGLGDPSNPNDDIKWQAWDFVTPARSATGPALLGAERRFAAYREVAGGRDGVLQVDANNYLARGSFGLDSLEELLTFRAINSSEITSPLEATVGGRSGTALTYPGSRRLSPLRDNRSQSDETQEYAIRNTGANTPFDRVQRFFGSDVRQRLTTISGGRQFRSVSGVSSGRLGENELKINAIEAIDNTRLLFLGYADALALDSDRTGAWQQHSNATTFFNLDTLFYGYRGPEAAMHIAAHMAVNMKDANDGDNIPSVYALVTDRDGASASFSTDSGLPKEQQLLTAETYGAGKSNNLSLATERLAPNATSNLDSAPVTKVFGIEPQPFLTQISSLTVYIDRPAGANPVTQGGDTDGDTNPNPPNPDDALITIKGDVGASGDDCLYRVLAFQLTNPFDKAITLSSGSIQGTPNATAGGAAEQEISQYLDWRGASPPLPLDRDESFHYITYGDKTFKLVSMEQPVFVQPPQQLALQAQGLPARTGTNPGWYVGFSDPVGQEMVTMVPITIQPGKSVVLCALSRVLPSRVARVAAPFAASATPALRPIPTDALPLISRALGYEDSDVSVYVIPQVDTTTPDWTLRDPTSPNSVGSTSIYLEQFPATGSNPSALLYRAVREDTSNGGEASTKTSGGGDNPNIGSGKMFWDGTAPLTFATGKTYPKNNPANDQLVDRFIPPTGFEINRKLPTGQNFIENTRGGVDNASSDGFAIMLWAFATRPQSQTGALPPGALPGYCLQPKYVDNWNFVKTDQFPSSGSPRLRKSDFVGNPQGAFAGASQRFTTFYSNMKQSTPPLLVDRDLGTPPTKARTGVPFVGNGARRPNTTVEETAQNAYNANVPVVFTSGAGAGLTASRTGLTAANQVSTLRLADLLLPLGFGPEFTPYDNGGTAYDLSIADQARVAWTTLGEAAAMAMGYDVLTPPTPISRPDPAFLFAPRQVGTSTTLIFDRGALRTDDYVPFVDSNTDGLFAPSATEYRAGLELPLAYNVLDQFVVTPAGAQARDRAIPGLVNVNTASMAVLRVVPGLAPLPSEVFPTNDTTTPTKNLWWRSSVGATSVEKPPAGLIYDRTTSVAGAAPDIATTIAAYRDKMDMIRRAGSAGPSTSGYPAPGFVSFADEATSGGARLNPAVDLNSRSGANSYASLSGRTTQNQIGWTRPAASGTAAVATGISELPGLRSVGEILGARNWDPTTPATRADPYNIDFMAFDGGTTGRLNSAPGFETGAPTDLSSYATYAAKARPTATRERLALANVALNSLSTRSDYFAVWFLVNGYSRADVSGLSDNDPLIPSIQRRFLMVLDRSNVTRAGDKPKVLLFKELPVREQYPKTP